MSSLYGHFCGHRFSPLSSVVCVIYGLKTEVDLSTIGLDCPHGDEFGLMTAVLPTGKASGAAMMTQFDNITTKDTKANEGSAYKSVPSCHFVSFVVGGSSLRGKGLAAPVADFLQTTAASMLEKPYPVAGVLKFVDVGPDLGFPIVLMGGRFAAGGATGMQGDRNCLDSHRGGTRQFNEDASHFLDLFVLVEDVLVAQKVPETEFPGLYFSLGAGVKGTVFRPQLLGGVARHPENFLVSHRRFAPGSRS